MKFRWGIFDFTFTIHNTKIFIAPDDPRRAMIEAELTEIDKTIQAFEPGKVIAKGKKRFLELMISDAGELCLLVLEAVIASDPAKLQARQPHSLPRQKTRGARATVQPKRRPEKELCKEERWHDFF